MSLEFWTNVSAGLLKGFFYCLSTFATLYMGKSFQDWNKKRQLEQWVARAESELEYVFSRTVREDLSPYEVILPSDLRLLRSLSDDGAILAAPALELLNPALQRHFADLRGVAKDTWENLLMFERENRESLGLVYLAQRYRAARSKTSATFMMLRRFPEVARLTKLQALKKHLNDSLMLLLGMH